MSNPAPRQLLKPSRIETWVSPFPDLSEVSPVLPAHRLVPGCRHRGGDRRRQGLQVEPAVVPPVVDEERGRPVHAAAHSSYEVLADVLRVCASCEFDLEAVQVE